MTGRGGIAVNDSDDGQPSDVTITQDELVSWDCSESKLEGQQTLSLEVVGR